MRMEPPQNKSPCSWPEGYIDPLPWRRGPLQYFKEVYAYAMVAVPADSLKPIIGDNVVRSTPMKTHDVTFS